MVAHQDTNACHDNDRHVRCQCSSPQFITPWSDYRARVCTLAARGYEDKMAYFTSKWTSDIVLRDNDSVCNDFSEFSIDVVAFQCVKMCTS